MGLGGGMTSDRGHGVGSDPLGGPTVVSTPTLTSPPQASRASRVNKRAGSYQSWLLCLNKKIDE